jgi:hypothetical protein
MADMDIFDRISQSQATQSGNWMRDGKYLLAIKDIKYEERFSGLTWITEMIVVEAEPMPGMLQLGGDPCAAGTVGATLVEPNGVGEKVSFVATVGNKNTPNASGNVKAFLMSLWNVTEGKFNTDEALARQAGKESPFKQTCGMLIGPSQPMRGALIRAHTSRKINQGRSNASNKGKILVQPSWIHFPHNPQDIAIRRALIEQGLPIPVPPPAPAPSAHPVHAAGQPTV